jgi:Zn-dependent protease
MPSAPNTPPPPQSRLKKWLGPLGALGLLLWKFKAVAAPVLKFFPVLLKTGGTMLLTIGVYTLVFGWKFAVGFVLLLFVHECGHLIAARWLGLKVGAPVFIPFMGAFIALRDAPRNAWIEAWVGIGGPLLGSLGGVACYGLFLATDQVLFAALAWMAFFLNLFNLAPIGYLDGGRIVTAISPWLWLVGFAVMVGMLFVHVNLIVILILMLSIPRVLSLFRKQSDEERRYFEVEPWQRVTMSTLYFGLVAALLFGMKMAHVDPNTLRPDGASVQGSAK